MPTKTGKAMIPKDQRDSPSIDEGSSRRSLKTDGQVLKKGPWTSAEDAILVEYVKKHGEGNWNAVQKNSGLLRCGKSCRLRWANHLRPNLKKGAFTPEEEQLIIKLHVRMGNKWARMAAHLPGRTDNEIKNYWNTRIKRLQRAGLPLYPSNVCFQASDENQQKQTVSCVAQQHNEVLQGKSYDFPDITFDHLNTNHGDLYYASPFPDISVSSLICHEFESQGYGYTNPMNCVKQFQESETLDPCYHGAVYDGLPSMEQFPIESSGKTQLTFGLGYPYDPDPTIKILAPFGGEIPGNQASSNGNFSASRSFSGTVKLELPSLQYTVTDDSSWPAYPSTQPLDVVYTHVESSPTIVSMQSECVSPQNSGLLEALLRETQALSSSKRHSSEKSSSSAITHNEVVESSGLNLSVTEWEEYNDPLSPLGCSAASVFNERTPPIIGSSFHEFPPSKATSVSAGSYRHNSSVVAEHLSTHNVEEKHISSHPDFPRPDALLGSGWLEEGSQSAEGCSTSNDAVTTLLSQDFCYEHKPQYPLEQHPLCEDLSLNLIHGVKCPMHVKCPGFPDHNFPLAEFCLPPVTNSMFS